MKNNNLSNLQRSLIFLSGILLVVVLFVPLWQIELAAPQYPEGLVLKMYPHKIAGNVDIINGLNHYIGMKTLHTNDFIEFTVLPYIVGFFALLCFIVALQKKRKWLIVLFTLFVIFGIVAMIDFWRWEYAYGHDLNPEAPIQVPGMAYQPPLIGYKQLLNFGAYSIPDIGGWLFILVGLLLLTVLLIPVINKKRNNMLIRKTTVAAMFILIMGLSACNSGPQPIKLGTDACTFCKMTIADRNFGAEILTKKGKAFKFDDTHCMVAYRKKDLDTNNIKTVYFINFLDPHNFIEADKVYLLKSAELHSPMGGNTAAFENEEDLKMTRDKVAGDEITLEQLFKTGDE
ncbi:MAG: nitrous oxide reductase accessory protein NosL [Ginsengibacter sp.]